MSDNETKPHKLNKQFWFRLDEQTSETSLRPRVESRLCTCNNFKWDKKEALPLRTGRKVT